MTGRKILAYAGLLAALAILAPGPRQARADFELVWEPNSPTNIATGLWDYSAFFNTQIDPGTGQPAAQLMTGDFVTLYDFGGYVPGSLKLNSAFSSEFTLVEHDTGITPAGISVPDSPSLPNFTLTYTGPTLTTSTSFIDVFTLNTTFTGTNPGGGNFADQVTKASGPSTGTPIAGFGFITTPAPAAVPEPASILIMGIGTAAAFGLGYRRLVLGRRRAAA